MDELKRLYERAAPYHGRLQMAVVCAILAAPFAAIYGWALKVIVKDLERVATIAERGQLFERIGILAAGLPLLFLLSGIFTYGASYLMAFAGQGVVAELRSQLFRTLVDRPVGWLGRIPSAEFVARVTSDIQRIETGLCLRAVDLMVMPLRAVCLTAFLWFMSPRLALLPTVLLPVAGLLVRRWSRKIRSASRVSQERIGSLATIMSETLGGIRVVKAYQAERHETERFDAANLTLRRASIRAYRTLAASSPILEVLGGFVLAGLLGLAAHEIASGRLHHADFAAFLGAMLMLFAAIKKTGNAVNELQHTVAASRRCFEILDAEVTGPETATVGRPIEGLAREIVFDHVSFAYGETNVLSDFSMVVQRGQTIGLVGESGAGKTTLTGLLARFHDPTSGRVLWDGCDTRTIQPASLRAQVALVTQDTVVFDESVLANIAYGDPKPDAARAIAAAKAALAHDFIEKLEEGYATKLGERGSRLSGGQRQRIALARAVYKDAPVWILDEPTSSLDSQSEALLQDRLRELIRDRTAFIVAHRLATVKEADCIVVLSNGQILEQGTHAELVGQAGGAYREMHRLQSGAR